MEYDKVVDSAALDTQLTSIADAIRAKTGGSNSLVFPDGFLQAIAAIQAGGGGGSAKIATGTVIPANDESITIEHGLGEVPNVFFWCTTDFVNHTTNDYGGGVRVTSRGNNDTLCGGHIAGQSFAIKASQSLSELYNYELYSNNQDEYSRKIYDLRSDKISSNCGKLARKMAGETVRWAAMVV